MSSMASARQSETLTTGTAIATEAIEKLQALPWTAVGLYNEPGYRTTAIVGGVSLPTIGLGPAPNPRPANAPKPLETRTLPNGKQYTIRTDIVWRTQPRYRWFRVQVSWNDGTLARSTVMEGRRARRPSDSGAGQTLVEPFRIRSFTVTPDPVELNPMGRTDSSTNPALEGGAALLIEVGTTRAAAANSVVVTYEPAKSVTLTAVPDSAGLQWRAFVQPDPVSVYYTKLITFTANAREAATNLAAPVDTTAAMFLRKYVDGPSYVVDGPSPRELLYPATPTASSPDRVCVAQSGNAANNKPLSSDTTLYFGLGGLEAPDATAATPGDTVTLTRLDAGSTYVLTLTHFVYNGTEYWRGTLPSSGSTRPTFLQDTISRWELKWSRSYDGRTWAPRIVQFYVTPTNQAC